MTELACADHLIALPGSDWALWRWSCLRGTGFPSRYVLELAATEAAAASDLHVAAQATLSAARQRAAEVMKAELDRSGEHSPMRDLIRKARRAVQDGRATGQVTLGPEIDACLAEVRVAEERVKATRLQFEQVFAADRRRISGALRQIAGEPRFREAVTWQNPHAVETGLDALLRTAPERLNSKARVYEDLVVNYVARYCVKNDSIGFFGPIGWMQLESSDRHLRVAPGPSLLARRTVYFEQWCVDALASTIAKDERLEPWFAPRRFPFLRFDGNKVVSAVNGRHELSPEQVLVLRAADGERVAQVLAADLVREHPQGFESETVVYDILRVLRGKQLLSWSLVIPMTWEPEKRLRSVLEGIGDDALRGPALASLDAFERGREAVAAAAGDAVALRDAVASLEATFTSATGGAASRNSGEMYAARGLVFEDTRRNVEVAFGTPLLAAIGPTLSLVLTSARWLMSHTAQAYRVAYRKICTDLFARSGTTSVPFSDFWFRAQRLIHGATERPVDAVVAGLQERWSKVLRLPPGERRVQYSSADLEAPVREAFAAEAPGWSSARYQCPDLMIAAPSVEAIERGDYQVVLGELHIGMNTLEGAALVGQHPRREELLECIARDFPAGRVKFSPPKDFPGLTLRTFLPLTTAADFVLETGFDPSSAPAAQVLRLGDLVVVEEGGQIVVRSREGGTTFDILEIMGDVLSRAVVTAFQMFARHAHGDSVSHAPRVTIDRVVVSRESWSFPLSEFAFAHEAAEAERFYSARQWARAHGLPRYVFAKAKNEKKPIYIDFDSPLFVNALAKLARRAKEHGTGDTPISVSEMLPAADQLWLRDAAGEHYTSEFRVVARDPGNPGQPAADTKAR